LAVLIFADRISAPVHAGGIVDRIFNGGAKNLAKQTMELAKYAADIEKRTVELQAKAAEVEEKTAALSAKDRGTFQAELARLGFEPQEWLFSDVPGLLSGADDDEEDAGGSGGGIGGFFGGIFGGSSSGGASSGSGGTFTLTGIPSQYNGKYALLMLEDARGDTIGIGVQTASEQGVALVPIRSGRAVLNMYTTSSSNELIRYTGNDLYKVTVGITSYASMDESPGPEVTVEFAGVSFRNGSASKAWRDGTVESGTTASGGSTPAPAPTPAQTPAPTPTPTPAPVSGPLTWTLVSDRPFGYSNIHVIAYGNGMWVAGGRDGKIAYSMDGRSWTASGEGILGTYTSNGVTYPSGFNDLTWGNNRFVGGGADGKMAYSADSQSWTRVEDSTFGDSNILAVAYGNNRFVAGGEHGRIAYSMDGVTWTAVADSGFSAGLGISDVAYGNGRFVVVGAQGTIAYVDW
jgi:hypothetical protein